MKADSKTRAALGLIVFLVMCFAVASIGAAFPPDDWYAQLAKPAFNPPAWIFAPVWTLLYVLMAVAAWRVWCDGSWHEHRIALSLFVLQLGLNGLWSPLFFGLKRMDLALLNLVFLWLVLLVTILRFRRTSGLAAALLLPYLAWVSFAGVLNYSLLTLN